MPFSVRRNRPILELWASGRTDARTHGHNFEKTIFGKSLPKTKSVKKGVGKNTHAFCHGRAKSIPAAKSFKKGVGKNTHAVCRGRTESIPTVSFLKNALWQGVVFLGWFIFAGLPAHFFRMFRICWTAQIAFTGALTSSTQQELTPCDHGRRRERFSLLLYLIDLVCERGFPEIVFLKLRPCVRACVRPEAHSSRIGRFRPTKNGGF